MTTLRAAIHLTDSIRWRSIKKTSRDMYISRVTAVADILGWEFTMERLKRQDVGHIVGVMLEQGLKNNTIRKYLQAFFVVIEEMVEQKVVPEFKHRDLVPRSESTDIRVVSREEEQMIYRSADKLWRRKPLVREKFKLWVEFTILTGLRRGESIVSSTKSESTATRRLTKDKLVFIENSDGVPIPCIRLIGKGYGKGKERFVPLSPRAYEIWQECFKINDERAPADNYAAFWPLKESTVRRGLKECWYDSNMGGKPITPHSLRHTYGTRMSEKSDVFALSKSMGHTSVSTTQQYVHLNPARVVDGIQASW